MQRAFPTQIVFRVTADLDEAFAMVAARNGRTKSQELRRAMWTHLEREADPQNDDDPGTSPGRATPLVQEADRAPA